MCSSMNMGDCVYVHRSFGKSCCVGGEGAACGERISSVDLVGNALPVPTLQSEHMLAAFVAWGAWLLFAQMQDAEGMEGQMFLQTCNLWFMEGP